LIAHGHVTVNGRRVDVPSYLLKAGDVLRVKNRTKSLQAVQANLADHHREVPDFLSVAEGPIPEGRVSRLPEEFDVSIPVQTQLIVELCSK
jgi:small subunit ribosomal protein S4